MKRALDGTPLPLILSLSKDSWFGIITTHGEPA